MAAAHQRPVESTLFRPQVSRFGGMVAQGHAVAVPEVREKHLEPWRGNTADTVPLWGSDTDFRSPSRSTRQDAGSLCPGLNAGYTPHIQWALCVSREALAWGPTS
jgi:hypothetical protein